MFSLRFARVVAVGLALATGATAAARDAGTDVQVNQAAALYRLGKDKFAAGDYQAATDAFERAYALSPRPPLLYNIGLAALQAKQPQKALRSFELYVAAVPPSPQRTTIERVIADLRRQGHETGRDDATKPIAPPADLAADSAAAATAAPTARLSAPPATTSAPAASSDSALVDVGATKPAARGVAHRGWFWATVVGGALVIGGAVALGVVFGARAQPPHATGIASVQ